MTPPDKYLYEYSVVRYLPYVDREEFVNIGLIMLCKRQKWLKGKIHLDKSRLQAFDPRLEIDKLESQTGFFTRNDLPSNDLPVEEKYRWLTAVKSASLQTSPSHPGIIVTESDKDSLEVLNEEFDRLFNRLVKAI